MTQLLEARGSSLVVVTLAEELPVTETNEALAELEAEQLIRVDRVIVNRVVRPLGVSEARLDELDDEVVRDAGLLHRGLYENQKRWKRELPEHHSLPLLFGEHDPAQVASRLAAAVSP